MGRTRQVAVAIGALVAACATGPAQTPFSRDVGAVVHLTVDNQDFRDATVYVDWNGVRKRVGLVIGKTTQTFPLVWADYTVRIEVDFVGGGQLPASDPVSVWAGDHLEFTILPQW